MTYHITVPSLMNIHNARVNVRAFESSEQAEESGLHNLIVPIDVEPIWGKRDFADGIWLTRVDGTPVFDPIPYHAVMESEDVPTIAADIRAFQLLWMRSLSEEDYRHTAHWYFLERDALNITEGRCVRCEHRDTSLTVLHTAKGRRGYERREDLIVLCATCFRIHKKESE